jgi:predicted N-formylglutamate amidohydrolase
MHIFAMMDEQKAAPHFYRPEGRGGVLILCDHASAHIPDDYEGLGLDRAVLSTHIAVDIGAAEVSLLLADLLDAPALLAPVSRLVVDLNRDPETQDPCPPISDGIPIPGNTALDEAARAARLDRWFHPYHKAAEDQLAGMMARGERPIVIGLHSFTPVMKGEPRPWQIGFLYAGDDRLYRAMQPKLASDWGLDVGDNQPYSGAELYYTMHRHGERHGLMQATIEIRQDLIANAEGQRQWADILAQSLRPLLLKRD